MKTDSPQFSIDFELGMMASIAGALLDWHNSDWWKTPADDASRTGISKWRQQLEDIQSRVADLPASDAKHKAITGLNMLGKAMPLEAGPNAAKLLAKDSNKAALNHAILLLNEAELLLSKGKPDRPTRTASWFAKNSLKKVFTAEAIRKAAERGNVRAEKSKGKHPRYDVRDALSNANWSAHHSAWRKQLAVEGVISI